MERCNGCHTCSLACARLVHRQLSRDTEALD
jgi:Fe-S-cluster-containing dehydrogenase component